MKRWILAGKIVFAGFLVMGLVRAPYTSGQDVKKSKPKKVKAERPEKSERSKKEKTEVISKEDQIILATAKKTLGAETERDRWMMVMETAYPGATVADARGEIDFGHWFDVIASGQPEWSLKGVRDKRLKEVYLRASQRLELGKAPIPREAFLAYAAANLSQGNSPPWKTPRFDVDPFDNAAKVFTSLDKNKNSVLESSEQTVALRAVAAQFDTNQNQVMEYEEYREYFSSRMTSLHENPPALPERSTPSKKELRSTSESQKSAESAFVLPRWYFELDDDHDGQVGLYEWRAVGERPLGEFAILDGDHDGLLTPYEMKHLFKNDPGSTYLKNSLPSIPTEFLRR